MREFTVALLFLLVPMSAVAQQVTRSFDELATMGHVEEEARLRVSVTSGDGVEVIEGTVVAITASSITIETDSPPATSTGLDATSTGGVFNLYHVEIPASRVRQVERVGGVADSLRNGALIGGAVGVGAGVFFAALCDGADGCVPFWVALSAGAGAGAGIGLDLVFKRGRETVYEAPASGLAAVDLYIAPVVSRHGRGVRLTLIW